LVPWVRWEPLASVGEALIVAAILAFTVDQFVKEHFIREVTKDVFHLIIGYDVPPEVKQRIKDLIQISLIAMNRRVTIRIESKAKSTVRVYFAAEWQLRNLKAVNQPYTPSLAILESDHPTFISHSVISKRTNYALNGDALISHVIRNAAAGVLEFRGETFDVQPASTDGDYIVKWEYSVISPRNHYLVEGFGVPTIGATFSVSCPPGFEISVAGDLKRVGNEWSSVRLFERGEVVTVQWTYDSSSHPSQ
jgi:hypothetical protein